MAKRDVPRGWTYDSKTRGAHGPHGEYLSRGQLEKRRIIREEKLPRGTRNIYAAKARKRATQQPTPIQPVLRGQALGKARREGKAPLPAPKPRLPRRLRVYYSGRTKQRTLLATHTRYRVKTFADVLRVTRLLAGNTIVQIVARGRNPQGDSPRFRGSTKRYRNRLRWVTLTRSQFRADEIDAHQNEILENLRYFYDLRAFDIIAH